MINPQILESQQTPNTRPMKKTIPRNIIIGMLKLNHKKKKNLKQSEEKRHSMYRRTNIKRITDFSLETRQEKMEQPSLRHWRNETVDQ